MTAEIITLIISLFVLLVFAYIIFHKLADENAKRNKEMFEEERKRLLEQFF